jgi:hypothetical protein
MPNDSDFQPLCPYCAHPVELEDAKTDEDGKAIHSECYPRSLKAQRSTLPSQTNNDLKQTPDCERSMRDVITVNGA